MSPVRSWDSAQGLVRDKRRTENFTPWISERNPCGALCPQFDPGTRHQSCVKRACPPKRSAGGYRIAAIILPCQGRDAGPTPATRSFRKIAFLKARFSIRLGLENSRFCFGESSSSRFFARSFASLPNFQNVLKSWLDEPTK